jgi:hypothetical protein
MENRNELSVEYKDMIQAYDGKVSELIMQLIKAEAKLIASANFINKISVANIELQSKVKELESQIESQKATKTPKRTTKTQSDVVMDYNN